ncbi:MAG TPA: hypothetical protein VGV09_07485 [Steroidobacteraceae bacterium]|nr:hypothetical protein [Steroidobacteraceae bacterium]
MAIKYDKRWMGMQAAAMLAVALAALAPGPASAGTDLCKSVSPAAVSKALHATIVRAEAPEGSDAGCAYSAKGTPVNSSTNHAMAMANGMGGAPLDAQSSKLMSGFFNGVLGDASAKQEKQARHPGEIPVLVFSVSTGDAQEQMKLNRDTMGRMSKVTTVPGLGDDAIETSGSMLMVRKGDKFIQFLFTQCNCASQDVIPLAKQIIAGL